MFVWTASQRSPQRDWEAGILLALMPARAPTVALAKVSTPAMHCTVSFVFRCCMSTPEVLPPKPVVHLPGGGEHRDLGRPWPSPVTRFATLAVVPNDLRAIVLSLRTTCSLVHLGHAGCKTLSGLISLDAGLQTVA